MGKSYCGQSGVDQITQFDSSNFSVKIAAEVKDFDPLQYIERKEARKMDRFVQFAIAASLQAVQNANIDMEQVDANRVGVYVGSGIGGLGTLEQQHRNLLEKGLVESILSLFR